MASAKSVIVVLGSHRSGTSVITGSLLDSGFIVPGPVLGPQRDVNETGFFEPVRLVELNDEIFRTLNRRWFSHFPLAPSQLPFRLKRGMLQLLKVFFQQSDRIILKDPRMCQLFGLWVPFLKRFDSNFKIIVVVRDPKSAVNSLRRRDGIAVESALIIHLLDLFSLEIFSRAKDRVIIEFEKFTANPGVEIAGVLKRLGLQISSDTQSPASLFRLDLVRQNSDSQSPLVGGMWRIAEHAHCAIVNEDKSKVDLLRNKFYRLLKIYRSTIEKYEQDAIYAVNARWSEISLESEKQNARAQIEWRDEVIEELERLLSLEKQNARAQIEWRDEVIEELERLLSLEKQNARAQIEWRDEVVEELERLLSLEKQNASAQIKWRDDKIQAIEYSCDNRYAYFRYQIKLIRKLLIKWLVRVRCYVSRR